MAEHKITKALVYNSAIYRTPSRAARAIAEYKARQLAQPQYLDANPRSSWDYDRYWKNVNRIANRAYPRILRAVTRMMS